MDLSRLLGLPSLIEDQCEDVAAMVFSREAQLPQFLNPLILITLYALASTQLRMYDLGEYESVIVESEERVDVAELMALRPLDPRERHQTVGRRIDENILEFHSARAPSGQPSHGNHVVHAAHDDHRVQRERRVARQRDQRARLAQHLQRRVAHAARVQQGATQADIRGRERGRRVEDGKREQGDDAGVRLHPPAELRALTVLHDGKSQQKTVEMRLQAWSIMYHSWFTFVLLLMSCTVWIVPDSRALSLRLSPFVLIYSQVRMFAHLQHFQLLIIIQFVYGLALTESELPDEHPAILRQLGFEKPRDIPSCVPLMIKSLFTLMFAVTFRQYLQVECTTFFINS